MKFYLVFTIYFILIRLAYSQAISHEPVPKTPEQIKSEIIAKGEVLYNQISGVSETVSKAAFVTGFLGQQLLINKGEVRNWPELGIIDMDKPSNKKRFLVVDLSSKRTLISTLVSHGKNSGGRYAKSFSNVNNSLKSSLGFYTGANSYTGKYGYSLRYNGLDSYYNSRVMSRAIVLHKAWYVRSNYAGKSYGCTAVNRSVSKALVNLLKNGRVLFVYHSSFQNSKSTVLNSVPEDSIVSDYINVSHDDIEIDENPPSVSNMERFEGVSQPTLSSSGGSIYSGSENYSFCQGESSSSWDNVVSAVGTSELENFYRSTWIDKQAEIEDLDGDITLDILKDEAINHYSEVKGCTALASMSKYTDFSKENINESDSFSSFDGEVTCEYKNSQSQDFSQCKSLVTQYNSLLSEENDLEKSHKNEYEKTGKEAVDTLSSSKSIQTDAFSKVNKMNTLGSQMATEAANLTNQKISVLKAIRDTLPNKETLLDDCNKFMQSRTINIDKDFLSFTSQFDENFSTIPNIGNSCERTMIKNAQSLIQNSKARVQANETILKLSKKGSEEYEAALMFRKYASVNLNIGESYKSGKSFFSSDHYEENKLNTEPDNLSKDDENSFNSSSSSQEMSNNNSGNKGSGRYKPLSSSRVGFASKDVSESNLGSIGNVIKEGGESGNSLSHNNGIYNNRLAMEENNKEKFNSNNHSRVGRFRSVREANLRLNDISKNSEKSLFDIISIRYKVKYSKGFFR